MRVGATPAASCEAKRGRRLMAGHGRAKLRDEIGVKKNACEQEAARAVSHPDHAGGKTAFFLDGLAPKSTGKSERLSPKRTMQSEARR